MCEATVYVEGDGQRQKVMQDVVRIEVTESGIVLSRLLEPPQIIQGAIREVDFLKHAVTLVSAGAGP